MVLEEVGLPQVLSHGRQHVGTAPQAATRARLGRQQKGGEGRGPVNRQI